MKVTINENGTLDITDIDCRSIREGETRMSWDDRPQRTIMLVGIEPETNGMKEASIKTHREFCERADSFQSFMYTIEAGMAAGPFEETIEFDQLSLSEGHPKFLGVK